MIDFHTHILPGLDDGSRDEEETEGLLREEVRQGVHRIVMTPHFYANRVSVEEFLNRRAASIERMTRHLEALTQNPASDSLTVPQMQFGAEVYFFPGMGKADKLPSLCVEGTNLLLLEMPFAQWDESVLNEVRTILKNQGLRIVLAHVERYPEFQKSRRIFEQVLSLPLTIQLNGGSFLKSRSKRKFCLQLLEQKPNIILGSDTHNLTSRRPNLAEAREVIAKKLGPDRIARLDRTIEDLLTEAT